MGPATVAPQRRCVPLPGMSLLLWRPRLVPIAHPSLGRARGWTGMQTVLLRGYAAVQSCPRHVCRVLWDCNSCADAGWCDSMWLHVSRSGIAVLSLVRCGVLCQVCCAVFRCCVPHLSCFSCTGSSQIQRLRMPGLAWHCMHAWSRMHAHGLACVAHQSAS